MDTRIGPTVPEPVNCGRVPTTIDNRSENTVLAALQRLLPCTAKMDVATGTFEIGSFLALESLWQALERIRVVTGNETTRQTRSELIAALRDATEESIEAVKERDDTLTGLPAVRQALADKQVAVRVYPKAKFHAKAYLMEARPDQPVDYAVVGSSNFTRPGLTQNLELNLFTTDSTHIAELRKWYEQVWQEAVDVNPDLLNVIEPHLREYDPFTVYLKALKEYFAGRERPQDDWEANESIIYGMLSQYQKDGYHQALQIAGKWGGALLCDGVGLGKTYIGLMLLERCIRDGKRVLLVVPKSAKQSVWESRIRRHLEPRYRKFFKELYEIRQHTDFGRDGTISEEDLDYIAQYKDVIIVDEAHHFRNPLANRGRLFTRLAGGKELYMLTATPINNKLDDLYHLINYFAQDRKAHFASIGIHDLRKHFLETEKRIKAEHEGEDVAEAAESEDFLRTDALLRAVLIQRSRKYVRQAESMGDSPPVFPRRQRPQVINYSLKSVYETLYADVKAAFDKDDPFLTLAVYSPERYAREPDPQQRQTQMQVIGLIRTLLLKRLESSFKAFEASVEDLLAKMAKFLRAFAPEQYVAWETTNRRWWSIVQEHINQRLELLEEESEEEDELPPEYLAISPDHYDMEALLGDVTSDMLQLTDFLSKIYRRFYHRAQEGQTEDPARDDKLQQLVARLREDTLLKRGKVVIFTEFRDTARYLHRQLAAAGIKRLEEVDSARKIDRELVIKRFSPYYNCYDEAELQRALTDPIQVLISTDVLSEGLNLQDACLVINYDLHWNPVRLMQRIGRVDRRQDPDIEARLKRPKQLAGKVYFWNFMPPEELEDLLHLVRKLTGKITRINAMLGIEGALLTPDDPDMSLREFNERFEGRETVEELMSLEKQRLAEDGSELWNQLDSLPRRLFSGKETAAGWTPIINRKGERISDRGPNERRGIFLAYRMPAPEDGAVGEVRYYFCDAVTGAISEDLDTCWRSARCAADTHRTVRAGVQGLAEARKAVETHISRTYLRSVQAAFGAKPILVAWMEIV